MADQLPALRDVDRPLTIDAEFTIIREPRRKIDWRRFLWGIKPPGGYTPEMIEEWERLPFLQKYEFRFDCRPAMGALILGLPVFLRAIAHH
jgi:hypothetical protein